MIDGTRRLKATARANAHRIVSVVIDRILRENIAEELIEKDGMSPEDAARVMQALDVMAQDHYEQGGGA